MVQATPLHIPWQLTRSQKLSQVSSCPHFYYPFRILKNGFKVQGHINYYTKLLQYNPVPQSKTQTLHHGLYNLVPTYTITSFLISPSLSHLQPKSSQTGQLPVPPPCQAQLLSDFVFSLAVPPWAASPQTPLLYPGLYKTVTPSRLLSFSHPLSWSYFFHSSYYSLELHFPLSLFVCSIHNSIHSKIPSGVRVLRSRGTAASEEAETSAALDFIFTSVIKSLKPEQQRGANTAHLVNSVSPVSKTMPWHGAGINTRLLIGLNVHPFP